MKELGTVLAGGQLHDFESDSLTCMRDESNDHNVHVCISIREYMTDGEYIDNCNRVVDTPWNLLELSTEHTSVDARVIGGGTLHDGHGYGKAQAVYVVPGDEIAIRITFAGFLWSHIPYGLQKTDAFIAKIRYEGRDDDGKYRLTVLEHDHIDVYTCPFYTNCR